MNKRATIIYRELHLTLHAVYNRDGLLVAAFVNERDAREYQAMLNQPVSTGNHSREDPLS